MMRILPLLLLTITWPSAKLAAESLESVEAAQLRRYLTELTAGQPGRAATVDQLADVSFAGLHEVIEAYIELDEPVEPHTHRSFQALLERTSRTALAPWPMLTLYSPELADFLTKPVPENPLAQQLCERLLAGGNDRRSFDLAVRLAPEVTLRHLADCKAAGRIELLEAWNRRLGRAAERRPIPQLDRLVATIATAFADNLPAAEIEPLLLFIAHWPAERAHYADFLTACFRSNDPKAVLAALAVQQRVPSKLELNEALVARFHDNLQIVQAAIKNYAFDPTNDHSAILRRLWPMLRPDDERARYNCLFSMGIHPKGNDLTALSAILESPYALIDVALPVLRGGDPERVKEALRHVLTASKRGHEEALRLASELQLAGFEDQALRVALDPNREQILRQTAMLYLRLAEGKTRRKLLPFLTHPNADLRLTAIQVFGEKRGLNQDDRDEIGPALIRVAIDDASMGHRQEAIHSLGKWREAMAADFFRKVLAENPPALLPRGHYNDEAYWRYRLRLVALLALARLEDRSARDELFDLHRHGGPVERMDVLLAFLDLGEIPAFAFQDLAATEPKLVATAAELIAAHGDPFARERLQQFFRRTPLWLEFKDSGLDDHNLLHAAGLESHAAAH